MATYEIRYDFGQTNANIIADAINDLNAGINTDLVIFHNSGGNAQLAVDLTRALLASSAATISVLVEGYANSAAAFVVMSVILFGQNKITLTYSEPFSLMYHRPRIFRSNTGLPYFDMSSKVCIEYDELMYLWVQYAKTGFHEQQAYYNNFDYLIVIT